MPIFRFVAVAAAILLALLFVADATFASRGPLFTNESEGLPRSQPIRPQVAEVPQEAPRPRAPSLAAVPPEQPAAASPVTAATIKAPPLAAVAEMSGTAAARTPDRAQSAKTEPARTEPARVATAELEAVGTEASKRDAFKRNAATTRTNKAAPKLKTRKQAARKSERSGHYATYRDDVPVGENGYAGPPFHKEWPEWQRPRGGEFDENRFRF